MLPLAGKWKMLKEITVHTTSEIREGDVLEVGRERLVVRDYKKGAKTLRTIQRMDGTIDTHEVISDGLYIGGNVSALSTSCILQLHQYGAKLFRQDTGFTEPTVVDSNGQETNTEKIVLTIQGVTLEINVKSTK
jgi:hypothetical protein